MDIDKHNKLRTRWKDERGPCVLCGVNEVKERDHLPPKSLYPKSIRTDKTYFYTFPTCAECNRSSSNNDFLLSVYLTFYLPQDYFRHGRQPSHPDHLALLNQWQEQLTDNRNSYRKAKLIEPYMNGEDERGNGRLMYTRIPVEASLIKFVRALYWFETDGDILENYKPGWWVFQDIDTDKEDYIDNLLKGTKSTVQWDNRFIAHYLNGTSDNDTGGFVSSSLHFYTDKKTGNGANWHVIAVPTMTLLDGKSLFEHCKDTMGDPTVEPNA